MRKVNVGGNTSKEIQISFLEFIIMMALLMSQVALTIDAILPALPQISLDFGLQSKNDAQLGISILFLGLATGQLVYGPLSDSMGRKPAISFGIVIYFLGCFFSYTSSSLNQLLVGRVLQGFGLASPRIVTMALIRDQYKGNEMAKVMSFVMSIFILVPTIAPLIGQIVMEYFGWRAIFLFFIILSIFSFTWFSLRQKETLEKNNRRKVSIKSILEGLKTIITNKQALGFTIASGLISSPFIAYLSSSQQIFQETYQVGESFPFYFAVIALSVGAATFLNGKLVEKFGMLTMVRSSLLLLILISLTVWILGDFFHLQLQLNYFVLTMMLILFCIGIQFGNLNSLAMEPLGKIAGLGAAIVGSLSTFIALPFGDWIGRSFDGTAFPLIRGFLVFGTISFLLVSYLSRNRESGE